LESTIISDDSSLNNSTAIAGRQPKQLFFSMPLLKSPSDPSQQRFSNHNHAHSSNDTNYKEPLHEIVLQINSVNYIFEYYLSHDITYASEELANSFCVAKGKELIVTYLQEKSFSKEQDVNIALYEKCYVPLQNALMIRITEENQKIAFN
jgi:hypothetical protein